MKKRIISTIVTLSLAIALIFVAIPKETTKEDLPLKAYNFFMEEGFSSEQATSIVALIRSSSNFDSSATSNDGNFYGLCQWGYGRLENLESFADEKGKDVSDFETQLEFLVSELWIFLWLLHQCYHEWNQQYQDKQSFFHRHLI